MKEHEIPGHVTLSEGQGGLTKLTLECAESTAEIYLHGAHVTAFRKKGEAPLLFMSEQSDFAEGKAIRGGVPLVFPWFGPREGSLRHGIARTAVWTLEETSVCEGVGVMARLRLPTDDSLMVEYVIRINDRLSMELVVTNGADEDATFETCLHTYFQIADIHSVSLRGLKGAFYLDKVLDGAFTEQGDVVTFTSETDRVYRDSNPMVEIIDPGLGRKIRIEKCGSKSTVVWNPWIEAARKMPDFADEEYLKMVCVESGNVGEQSVTLSGGSRAIMKVEISSVPLD